MPDQNRQERPCPVCGQIRYKDFLSERINPEEITQRTYSSRKRPEFMRLRLVLCRECDLVYAPSPPEESYLSEAYAGAAFDSGQEEQCAADSYIKAIGPRLAFLRSRSLAVEIGAGSGRFLPLLLRHGFRKVFGVEPSRSAIAAAPDEVRGMIMEGVFSPEVFDGINPSLVCSFMTLEHIGDPGGFVRAAYEALEPDGMLAVVVHNWRGALNRLLGSRSPIIDVEHLQLFSPASIVRLLSSAGFAGATAQPIQNAYPARYWLRLTPFPAVMKRTAGSLLELTRLADALIPMRVGNLLAVARKPR